MNNDYLRLNSKTDDEEIVMSEFDITQEQVVKSPEKKLTVWSILFNGKKKRGQKSDVDFPTFKGSFTVFLAITFIAVFLLFIALINKNAVFLLIDSFIIALLFPIAAITLFNDLKTGKKLSLTEILCTVIIGIFVYLATILINKFLTGLLTDYKTVSECLTYVLTDALLFAVAYIYVMATKKDDVFTVILACICIYSGYLIMRTTTNLIDSLYVHVSSFGSKVIIFSDNNEVFGRAATSFVNAVFKDGLYYPALIVCWATICASIIGLTALPFREIKEHSATYLLFLAIQIVLHLISYYKSTIASLNVLISILCLVFSLFCAVRMLNYALLKSKLLRPREE